MSLDNIHLTPFLVQDLYKKTLVDLNEKGHSEKNSPENITSFLGKNEKNMLIVIDEKETAFLNDSDLNLLVGILSACKLSLADIALVNFDKNKLLTYDKMMLEFNPGFVLLFGITPDQLSFPLNFPYYQLQQYNNQTYLSSPTLKILAAETDQKKELWASLQKYFFKK